MGDWDRRITTEAPSGDDPLNSRVAMILWVLMLSPKLRVICVCLFMNLVVYVIKSKRASSLSKDETGGICLF